MKSVTLLGDSIIDNISYVDPPGLCVLGHLSEIKPNWDEEIKSHVRTIKNAKEKFIITVVSVRNILVVACLNLL